MAVSFACPACKTLIQVGEDLSGQTGQCPRCERLLIIPSASMPVATLLDADGKPMPAAPTPARKPTPTLIDDDELRSPRRSVERNPTGPRWPWTLGVLGGIGVFMLLCSSFISLFAYRSRQTPSNLIIVEQKPWHFRANGVTQGRLEKGLAILENGGFQVHDAINAKDPLDHDGAFGQFRTRRYQMPVEPGEYVIELEFKKLNGFVRIEEPGRNARKIQHGGEIVRVERHFPQAEVVSIYVGNQQNADAEFTLTVRRINP